MPKALRALSELDAGIARLGASPNELADQLRIGATPTFNVDMVPPAAAAFTEHLPGERVQVEQVKAPGMTQEVLSQHFDMAIGYPPPTDEQRLVLGPLCNEELVPVAAARHALAACLRARTPGAAEASFASMVRKVTQGAECQHSRRKWASYRRRAMGVPHALPGTCGCAAVLT